MRFTTHATNTSTTTNHTNVAYCSTRWRRPHWP